MKKRMDGPWIEIIGNGKYYSKPSGTIGDEKPAACVIHARSSMAAFLGIQSPLELNIGPTIDSHCVSLSALRTRQLPDKRGKYSSSVPKISLKHEAFGLV